MSTDSSYGDTSMPERPKSRLTVPQSSRYRRQKLNARGRGAPGDGDDEGGAAGDVTSAMAAETGATVTAPGDYGDMSASGPSVATASVMEEVLRIPPHEAWVIATQKLPYHLQLHGLPHPITRFMAASVDGGLAFVFGAAAWGLASGAMALLGSHVLDLVATYPSFASYLGAFDPANWVGTAEDFELMNKVSPGRIGAEWAPAIAAKIASFGHLTPLEQLANAAGVTGACTYLAVRDVVTDEGNRSVGKKMAGLEITMWDGAIASQERCFVRNAYLLAIPFAPAAQVATDVVAVALATDSAALMLTDDFRRFGDWAMGTRVIPERLDRADRMQYQADTTELVALQRDLRAALGGTRGLAALEKMDSFHADSKADRETLERLARGSAAARDFT